jgi:hypothetical protein
MITPTKLRPSQVDYIQPIKSSVIIVGDDSTKSHTLNIPPNPVKRPEHPIYLESSYENVSPSTRLEPTESLTFIVGTNQKKQEYSTASNVEMSQKSQIIKYSVVNATANPKSSIIATRVDSSITKVTSTLLSVSDNKTRLKTSDSATQNIAKTTASIVARNESSTTLHMKPKEVRTFLDETSC